MEIKKDVAADGTLKLTITVPAKDVEKVRETVIDEAVKNVEAPGFRKGMAPRKIAEAKLSKEKIREEVLKRVVTDTYNDAIKQEKLSPIVTPKVHVEQFEEGTDLTYTAETCEEPVVDLGDYKDKIKSLTAKSKILKPGEKEPEAPKLEEIVETLVKTGTITIPHILIENEAQRLLAQLLDEIQRLGLTLDQFLASRQKTIDEIRKEYEERAEKDLKFEFLLRKVADTENITVEQKDIEDVMNNLKDEAQKRELAQNPYLFAALIRQQKTLDFLSKI